MKGTYSFHLINAGINLSYVATFTIASANTWQYVTLTIPGPTTGTWGTTNGVGIYAGIDLGQGSSRQTTANTWSSGASFYCGTSSNVQWINNSGATFYITGVQLEAGTTASPFEYRQYGTELALCQRYYLMVDGDTMLAGKQNGTTQVYATVPAPVPLRATPSASFVGGVTIRLATQSGYKDSTSTTVSVGSISTNKVYNMVVFNGFTGLTDWYVGNAQISGTLQLSAEL